MSASSRRFVEVLRGDGEDAVFVGTVRDWNPGEDRDFLDAVFFRPVENGGGERVGGPRRDEQFADEDRQIVVGMENRRVWWRGTPVLERRDCGQLFGGDVSRLFEVELLDEVFTAVSPARPNSENPARRVPLGSS